MATTTQVNQLPEYMQDYQKFMLDSAQAVASPAQFIPAQQAAPLTPGQTEAVRRGYEGVGSFAKPMLRPLWLGLMVEIVQRFRQRKSVVMS